MTILLRTWALESKYLCLNSRSTTLGNHSSILWFTVKNKSWHMLNKCYHLETKYLGCYKLYTLLSLSYQNASYSKIAWVFDEAVYSSAEAFILSIQEELVFIVLYTWNHSMGRKEDVERILTTPTWKFQDNFVWRTWSREINISNK